MTVGRSDLEAPVDRLDGLEAAERRQGEAERRLRLRLLPVVLQLAVDGLPGEALGGGGQPRVGAGVEDGRGRLGGGRPVGEPRRGWAAVGREERVGELGERREGLQRARLLGPRRGRRREAVLRLPEVVAVEAEERRGLGVGVVDNVGVDGAEIGKGLLAGSRGLGRWEGWELGELLRLLLLLLLWKAGSLGLATEKREGVGRLGTIL